MDTIIRDMNPVLQMLILMTVFSLIPLVFCCMTSFLRFVIVFSMLKTAMGTQQVPPSIGIVGLAMILTFYTMGGTFQKMYEMGSVPYHKNQNIVEAINEGSKPLKEFISELKTSFEIGFIIFVPFIVLDLVVANILLALGMFMLSPTIISLPFKLLIFIAVDGWALIVQGLVTSYN